MTGTGTFKVSGYGDHAAVYWVGSDITERGAAEASKIEGDRWFLNRVVVQPEALRRKQIGGKMLEKLKEELVACGCKELIVTPGGYGSDVKQLNRFYCKHGFEPDGDYGALIWRPTKKI